MGLLTVLLLAVLACFLIIYFAGSGKRAEKRTSALIETWSANARQATSEFKQLCSPARLFSDKELEGYRKEYSPLFYAIENFSWPKDEALLGRLTWAKDYHTLYFNLGKSQLENNAQYFKVQAKGLQEDYSFVHTSSRFIGYHEVERFKTQWRELLTTFHQENTKERYKDYLDSDYYNVMKEVAGLLVSKKDSLEIQRQTDNIIYKENELNAHSAYFDTVFKYPLDHQQRQAIVTLEDNTLVVSSAGSGKTSTIVGKVRYLVNQKHVSPDCILVLTYTRKAAAELRDRMGIEGITASTFHKHAIDTMGRLTGSRPSIVDESILKSIFDDLIENDKDFLAASNKYVTELTNLAKDDHKYRTAQAHASDLQKYGLWSPFKDGAGMRKIMKSKQEIQISIILTCLGVDYRYEEDYIVDTSTTTRRKYKPDFSIHYHVNEQDAWGRLVPVEKVLYYEHFGIDANGNVPIWFGDGLEGGWEKAQQNYTEGIAWKRSIHAKYHTDLMETTSADFERYEDMEAYIESLLVQHGVPVRHLSEEEKRALLLEANSRIDSTLFDLAKGFITLMKANKKTIPEIIRGIKSDDEHGQRNITVLNSIIQPIYERYQLYLFNNGEYDYTDVLLKTADLCEKENPYNYSYILVDEFQDISMDKYLYLKSLRKQNPFTTLFCVGDDWQSIYRFSGSDMTLFYDFQKFFGYTEECKIETTHRFGQPLLNASSIFILTNPEQKVKEVSTTLKNSTNIRFRPYSRGEELRVVEEIVDLIPNNESIFILGRYRFNADSIGVHTKNLSPKEPIEVYIKGRRIRYLTIHSSKGLEADHVIILDCEGGTYGFPSLISDDPILEYVLSGADSFENAEERRVFYVGITRARKSTYCLFNSEEPSPFLAEFGEFSRYKDSTEAICPRCHRGFVRVVNSGTTRTGHPFVTVNCTNQACDYFETVFDAAVYKYQPRTEIQSWPLRGFAKAWGATQYCLYQDYRIYCLVKKAQNEYVPIIVAPNIIVNDLLKEEIRRNMSDFRVVAIRHYDSSVYLLAKGYSSVFISNEELENSIRFAKSIATSINMNLVVPSVESIPRVLMA